MDSFECVLALSEFRNMTKASEYLFMTQPALTLRIQRLENELGIRIFDRSTRPISITPEGEVYIREMSKIRIAEERLRSRLNEMAGTRGQTITIGIGFNRGRYWLPDLLPMLMERNPQYIFQIREASDQDMEALVRNGEIEYGIIGSPIVSGEFAALEIGVEKIYIGVPAINHIFDKVTDKALYDITNPYTINFTDLDGETFIMGRNSYGLTRYMNLLFSSFHITPGKIIDVGNGETSYLLAAQGLGITFMFDSYHTTPLDNKMQRPIPCVIENVPLQRTVSLICKTSRSESALTESLHTIIKNYFMQSIL